MDYVGLLVTLVCLGVGERESGEEGEGEGEGDDAVQDACINSMNGINGHHFITTSSLPAEYGSTGYGCQSCWSAEQENVFSPVAIRA